MKLETTFSLKQEEEMGLHGDRFEVGMGQECGHGREVKVQPHWSFQNQRREREGISKIWEFDDCTKNKM